MAATISEGDSILDGRCVSFTELRFAAVASWLMRSAAGTRDYTRTGMQYFFQAGNFARDRACRTGSRIQEWVNHLYVICTVPPLKRLQLGRAVLNFAHARCTGASLVWPGRFFSGACQLPAPLSAKFLRGSLH